MSERVDVTMNWGVYIYISNPHERESRYYHELGSIYIYIILMSERVDVTMNWGVYIYIYIYIILMSERVDITMNWGVYIYIYIILMSERVDITMNWGVYIFNPHERESRYYYELGSIYIYIYILHMVWFSYNFIG